MDLQPNKKFRSYINRYKGNYRVRSFMFRPVSLYGYGTIVEVSETLHAVYVL